MTILQAILRGYREREGEGANKPFRSDYWYPSMKIAKLAVPVGAVKAMFSRIVTAAQSFGLKVIGTVRLVKVVVTVPVVVGRFVLVLLAR